MSADGAPRGEGRLVVVGVGYAVAGHVDTRSRRHLERADRVFFLVHDPLTASFLQSLNPRAESLHTAYRPADPGSVSAARMVERIVAAVLSGERVCAAFAGHPAIAVPPALEALRRVRAQGLPAELLPAISIEDCLVADVGFDPGILGRVLYEANDFVRRPRRIDPAAALILLQPGAVGDDRLVSGAEPNRAGLALLTEVLLRHYPPAHPVVLYERDPIPWAGPRIDRVALASLPRADVRIMTTLFVPPVRETVRDRAMLERLGMPVDT